MKPEAQRIAIAEACGFEKKEAPKHVFYWYRRNTFPNGAHGVSNLPDYLNDLNAMHEAEKTLARIKVPRYVSEIWAVMCRGGDAELMDIGTIHATAAQRAEAFLRTIGKWVEE